MKFKVINAHKINGVLFITGSYSPSNEDEKEFLEVMRQALEEVNRTVDGEVMCKRLVANDKTILFKSVPIEKVYSVLQLHNNAFDLHIHIVLGKNMRGHSLLPEVWEFFLTHEF